MMAERIQKFGGIKVIICVVLLIFITGAFLILDPWKWRGISPPVLIAENGEIASSGRIGLDFGIVMDDQSVIEHLLLTPEFPGQWEREGQLFWFTPDQPFPYPQKLIIQILAGAQSLNGKKIRQSKTYEVLVRKSKIIYLKNIDQRKEIWVSDFRGENQFAVSKTDEQVIDYTFSKDGNIIFYSAVNDQGGADIFQTNREGNSTQKIISCNTDSCTAPTISPNGEQLVYLKSPLLETDPAYKGESKLWNRDMNTGEVSLLLPDNPNVIQPRWSPTGQYLSYYDLPQKAIGLIDFLGSNDRVIPSDYGMNGIWSSDGNKIYFLNYIQSGTQPFTTLYEVRLQPFQVMPMFQNVDANIEFGWVASDQEAATFTLSARYQDGPYSNQIWIVDQNGNIQKEVTRDYVYTHSNIHWDNNHAYLVFQRFKINSSKSTPEVWVWSKESDQLQLISTNASSPNWLP